VIRMVQNRINRVHYCTVQYGVRISSGIWKTLVGNAPERHAGGVLGDVYCTRKAQAHTQRNPQL